MTRKDYILIAAVINRVGDDPTVNTWTLWRLANELSDRLAQDNPRFDRERFLKACGATDLRRTIRALTRRAQT